MSAKIKILTNNTKDFKQKIGHPADGSARFVLILNWLHADLDTILFYGTKIQTFFSCQMFYMVLGLLRFSFKVSIDFFKLFVGPTIYII